MDNDIRQIAKYETKCTGCGACVNVCPVGAIKLTERCGYFLFPEIDQRKCTHCGLCLKICPSNMPKPGPSHPTDEAIYGCYVSDEKERLRSSSGGVFQALAKYVIAQGGLVCGARFTGGCHLQHVIIDKEEDLPPLQGSKYLQSDPGKTYAQIKLAIQDGRLVLFSGTTCQVAGIKSVVGDTDRLITVDFCCHGVPPEKLFLQHIQEVTGFSLDEIRDIRIRDKSDEGWDRFHVVVETSNARYNVYAGDDVYMKAFFQCMTTRRSCAECRYARLPRMSDFTLGDLWTVAENRLHIRDNKGVSLVVLNSYTARTIFKKIRPKLAFVRGVTVQEVSATNNLEKCWLTPHPNRQRFFDALYVAEVGSVDGLMTEYLNRSDGVCLLNFHDAHNNYGSVLAGYALQEKVKALIVFSPISIRLWPVYGGEKEAGDLIDFNREKIVATELMTSDYQLLSLNKYCRTFIVGSDVVWRNSGWTNFDWLLLSFASISRNICSYAASFGFPFLADADVASCGIRSVSEKDKLHRKRLLKRFSHISVREDSGVEICKSEFDVEAEHVLDSVFLLRATDYSKLITDSGYEKPNVHFFANYVLCPDFIDKELLGKVRSRGKNVVALRKGGDFAKSDSDCLGTDETHVDGKRVGDWLGTIRDCDFFVTDSFHGTCFAIIFKKQFVCLRFEQFHGYERIESLFRMLGIPMARLVKDVAGYEYALAHPIDYETIEPKLNVWIRKSEDFLRQILADNKPNKTKEWLESVEMTIEDLKKSMPRHLTVKQQVVRVVRGIALRALRLGVISYVITAQSRTLVAFHVPIVRVRYTAAGKTISCLGIKIVRE